MDQLFKSIINKSKMNWTCFVKRAKCGSSPVFVLTYKISRFTGSEKGGLIQKIDDLKESIKQAGKTLEKGQHNLETIDGMYSNLFKLVK